MEVLVSERNSIIVLLVVALAGMWFYNRVATDFTTIGTMLQAQAARIEALERKATP